MTAICSRVILVSGEKVVAVVPFTIPFSAAQFIHIRGIIGICFHIGEFPGFIVGLVDARQSPQGGDEHPPRHASVGAELVVFSAGEQSPASHEDNVIRSPMVLNVRKVRDRVLVADAVDAEMPGFKDNRTQVRVIASNTPG